ncbi:protein kinase [Cryobacterium sp. Hh7]|uniref:protein kinase domain-containing protein n=1 Tax=Cryobacterium sp. Hh7 TaxID=1259159 RepID=UPI00141AFA46|nr:protein kinase [Cryobacterium sp. Hh7]
MKRRSTAPPAPVDDPIRFRDPIRRGDPIRFGPRPQLEVDGNRAPGSAALQSECVVAGYRLIRLLGTGDRAAIYLGHSGSGAMVALKIFRADTESASIESDIAVLTSAAAPGLVRLLDVAQLGDGRICLILERLAGGSLARYLIEHPVLSPGEAVTLLAPVVVALNALHSAEFAHGSLSQATVLLDATGRSVLTGFGTIRQFSDALRERMPLLRADYTRLATIGRCVCAGLAETDARSHGGAELIRRFHEAVDPSDGAGRYGADPTSVGPYDVGRYGAEPGAFLAVEPTESILVDLERALFDWADAEPLRGFRLFTEPDPGSAGSADPLIGGQEVAEPARRIGNPQIRGTFSERGHATERTAPGPYAPEHDNPALHDPDPYPSAPYPSAVNAGLRPPARALGNLVARVAGSRQLLSRLLNRLVDARPVEALGHGLRKRLHGRRRPILVAGLGGVSVLVLALTLFPLSGHSGRPGPAADAVAAGPPATSATPDNSDHSSDHSQAGGAPSDRQTPDAAAIAIAGDDPIAAVVALLAGRAACLAAASLVCLVGVDQTGSAVLALDSYDARQRQQGGSGPQLPDYVGHLPTLAERTGNLAVVALAPGAGNEKSQPASVLVVKGEGGWRLREIFDY